MPIVSCAAGRAPHTAVAIGAVSVSPHAETTGIVRSPACRRPIAASRARVDSGIAAPALSIIVMRE